MIFGAFSARRSLKYFKWSGWPINLNGTREGFSVDTIECSVGPNWDLDTRGERESIDRHMAE
jgi:hypothetical protein